MKKIGIAYQLFTTGIFWFCTNFNEPNCATLHHYKQRKRKNSKRLIEPFYY